MTESKVFTDNFSRSFTESGDFFQFLSDRKARSKWMTAPSRELQFEPVERGSTLGNSSLWYGGLVVSIKVRGCVFAIHACGDIYATLYDKSDGTELLYVKDKSNSGHFGVDVLPYLKTDHALYAAMGDTHKRYRLDMEHNNWWECFVYTPEGEFHDMMWTLDSDHIFEGVEVVLSAMDSVIKDITENKERIEYARPDRAGYVIGCCDCLYQNRINTDAHKN